MRGIETSKFHPIIRNVQNIKIDLSPVSILPAQKVVIKMLREKEPKQPQANAN
jgi:hypothetical protein